VSWRAFCWIHTGPTRAWKIVHQRFAARTYRIALHDPLIPLDAQTQGRCIVSRCTFCQIRTGPIRKWKNVHRLFTPRTHWNALSDLEIPPDAKTQIRCNVSRHTFYLHRAGPTRRTRMHNVTHRSHRRQKHKFNVMCPSALFMETALAPPGHEI
jgi:hypothetical protein